MNRNEFSRQQIWYDPDHDAIGFGQTYGEHSYNGRPVKAKYGLEALKSFLKRRAAKKDAGEETR
jgi:hypothetical protein